jgi:hypothetical protein
MSDLGPPVPPPGPRPADLVFPFAEARAALVAIEAALDDLGGCVRDHEAAADVVCRDFEGRSREGFERGLAGVLGQLAVRRRQLGEDADHLRAVLADAARRRAEREQQQRTWHEHARAHEADRAARRDAPRVG